MPRQRCSLGRTIAARRLPAALEYRLPVPPWLNQRDLQVRPSPNDTSLACTSPLGRYLHFTAGKVAKRPALAWRMGWASYFTWRFRHELPSQPALSGVDPWGSSTHPLWLLWDSAGVS